MNLTDMFFSHFDSLEDPREDNYKVTLTIKIRKDNTY